MKISHAKFAFILLGILTAVCTVGSISSTLAWYAYSVRALVAYSGTSVNSTSFLQVGIASDVYVEDMPTSVDHVTFAGDPRHYYFAKPGNGLTYGAISTYLAKKGHATTELQPVTSGAFASGDSGFGLKQAPNQVVHGNTVVADISNYLTIPFVFRVNSSTSTGDDFLDNKELWLSKTVVRANSSHDGEIYHALRIFIDRDDTVYGADNDYLINPSADADGQTKVGGVLELTKDGYYDFDSNGEILYGEYDPELLTYISDDDYTGESRVYDVNGTGNDSDITTFSAKHYPNSKYYSSLNDNLISKASYKAVSSIAPVRDEHDNLTNRDEEHPTSVCKTQASDHYLARVNMTVYLEGWDFTVIDEEATHGFDLGLTFEISHV